MNSASKSTYFSMDTRSYALTAPSKAVSKDCLEVRISDSDLMLTNRVRFAYAQQTRDYF